MGGLRRKRTLLKKVTSFNLYADQWAQLQAIMEGMKAQKEAPVLRELIDEALAGRRRKFVRQEDEEQNASVSFDAERLERIRLLLVKILGQSTMCLRVDDINLKLLQELLAQTRANRKRLWEDLVVPRLREQGYNFEDIANIFQEDTATAQDFAYALAEQISKKSFSDDEQLSDESVSLEVTAAG